MNDLSLLTPKERKVYECIPLGSAHPISQENLAKSAETSGRSIAEIVQTLRRKGFFGHILLVAVITLFQLIANITAP